MPFWIEKFGVKSSEFGDRTSNKINCLSLVVKFNLQEYLKMFNAK